MNISISDGLHILTIIITVILSVASAIWYYAGGIKKMSDNFNQKNEEMRKDFDAKLTQAREENEKKRSRIFERIDEVKENMSVKYVRNDICGVMHKQFLDTVDDIKTEISEIRKDIKELLKTNKEDRNV